MSKRGEGLRQRKQPITLSKDAVVEKVVQEGNERNDVPFLLKPWVYLQETLPEMFVGGLNISVMVSGLVYFYAMRQLATFIHAVNGWPMDHLQTNSNISCMVSLSHSSCMILPLFQCLFTQPYQPTRELSKAPKYWQLSADALLQFCTAYMVQDSFCLVYKGLRKGLQPGDELFLGHHFATITYMTQCRWIAAGHISTMTCILIGEISNPFMMIRFITKAASESICCNGPRVAAIFSVSTIIYAILYFIARSFLMPGFFLYKFHDFFLSGQKSVPFGLCVYWYTAILAIIVGSYGYIIESLEMIQDYFH